MAAFLTPTSGGLLVCALVMAVLITAGTAVCWDAGRAGFLLRFAGPPVAFLLLVLALLIAVNLQYSLFQTWTEVWSYLP